MDLSQIGNLKSDANFRGPFCDADRKIIGFDATPGAANPTLAQVRDYSAKAVNLLRWRTGLPPLRTDAALNDIGERAMVDLANGGSVHGYFIANCMNAANGFGTQCEAGWAQENFGSASGSARTWKDGIRVPLCAMMEEPFGQGHRRNIESTQWTRVGVGIRTTPYGASWVHEFGR